MTDVKFVRNSAGFRELLLSEDVERMLQDKADRVKAAAEEKGVTVNTGRMGSPTMNLSAITHFEAVLGNSQHAGAVVREHRAAAGSGGGPDNPSYRRATAEREAMPYDTEVHRSPSRVRVRVRAVHPAGARAEVKYRALGQAIDAAR